MARAVLRAMQILEKLGDDENGLTHTQLVKEFKIPKSSISAILNDLLQSGFVTLNNETKKYILGPKILNLAHNYLNGMDLIKVGGPIIKSLADITGESAAIYTKSGDVAYLVFKQDSPQPVSRLLKVGVQAPLYASAAGKVFLAHASESEKDQYFSKVEMKARTQYTITDSKILRENLLKIKKGSLAVNDEEFEEGVIAIAAPVYDNETNIVAALCVVAPSFRINEDTRKNIEIILSKKSKELSSRLGINFDTYVQT